MNGAMKSEEEVDMASRNLQMEFEKNNRSIKQQTIAAKQQCVKD